MQKARFYFLLLLVTATFIACTSQEQETDSSSSFVATLGKDTLVMENFIMQEDKVEAEVLIRTPRTRYQKHTLLLDTDGSFKSYKAATYDPKNLDGEPLSEQTIEIAGDSLLQIFRRDTTVRQSKFAFDPSVIPWIDMVHWPYEVATRQLIKEGAESKDQPMLTGRSIGTFVIKKIGSDSVSIKHPYRGTMHAQIDTDGALVNYDATATTRKLIVTRGGPIDISAMAVKYADHPIGSLSGAGKTETSVQGASLEMTFGQPSRRGRDLFGGIVPWNERWRTGANKATHIKTDKTLKFGALMVPAGEYTLFTIPTPEGGTLIINKQTGQNGNSYDETQDLGRVPMRLTQSDTNVELFTIDAIERAEKGILQLKWGETIFEIEFEVAD